MKAISKPSNKEFFAASTVLIIQRLPSYVVFGFSIFCNIKYLPREHIVCISLFVKGILVNA